MLHFAFEAAQATSILAAVFRMNCRSVPVIVAARLSFSLYLVHIFVQELYWAYRGTPSIGWIKGMSLPEMATIFIPASILIAWMLSLLVEYPFIRMYRKVGQTDAMPIPKSAQTA